MADPPDQDFKNLQKSLQAALIATTRTTSSLCAEDLPFQRSLDAEFASDLDAQNARLLSLAERLLASAAVADHTQSAVSSTSTSDAVHVKGNQVTAPRLRSGDELERNWGAVVDVVDSLLERTDGVLDSVKRALRKGGSAVMGQVAEAEKPAIAPKSNTKKFQQAANILKPQRTFDHPPNNFAIGPWKPILTSKPHAKVPLSDSLHTEQSTDGTNRQMYSDTQFHTLLEHKYNASFYLSNFKQLNYPELQRLINDKIRYRHPYQTEIEEYKFPPSMYLKHEPIPYKPYEESTATYVDTEEALEEMLKELKQAKEIAIDLEHHDQRTYIGIVCLMQISTREKDWVVDTLKPWRRKSECLNQVFTDPSILKVLHGSAMDVIWLQRDLGLYLVGLFDTEHAATALHYPKRSLAFLLEKWVNFQAQKQYQLADWRVRPLTPELFDYARSDTHFLLYVYDCMRNQLIENSIPDQEDGDLLLKVQQESKRYQLQRYENPFYDAENGLGPAGWYRLLSRTPALLSKQQFAVFKAVHQWRDGTARREDESLFFVMSNHLLQTIAREMPVSKEALLAMTPVYANIVRNNAENLVDVVIHAKEAGAEGPEMREQMAKSDTLADEQHNAKYAHKDELRNKLQGKTSEPKAAAIEPATSLKRPSINAGSVKAEGSAFWGSTLGSTEQRREMHMSTSPVEEVKLDLPMPEVGPEVFTANGQAPPKPDSPAQVIEDDSFMELDSPAPAQVSAPEPEDKVFTLREKGGKKSKKRKATEAAQDDLKEGVDEVGIDIPGITDDALEKARKRKERRKAEKQARREAEMNGQMDGTNDTPTSDKRSKKSKKDTPAATSFQAPLNAKQDATAGFMAALMGTSSQTKTSSSAPEEADDEPFDYANAPSVLNGGDAAGRKKKKTKRGKMEGFDPYKKALDTGKGVPRTQRERTGAAGTFKK